MSDKKLLNTIGVSGLKNFGGRIEEEFIPELKGDRAFKVFKQMSTEDATISSMLFAIKMLIRGIDWTVEPFSDKPRHVKQAQDLETMLHDMDMSWPDTLSEIMSFLIYGFSLHEVVLKKRDGKKSKYKDGLVGIKKLAIRGQETIEKWEYSEKDKELLWVEQRDPNTAKVYVIPRDKFLLFKAESYKENPMSSSVLRSSYRAWKTKRYIEDYEAIGISRDLAGMPVMYIPADMMSSDATPEQKQSVEYFKQVITSIQNNEQSGVLLPAMYDETGNRLFDFQLMSSGGTRQFDTSEIIQRYNTQIVQTVLADFIMLGQGSQGSYALSSNKTKMFTVAIQSWLKSVVHELNEKLVTKLGEFNGWRQDELPRIVHGELESQDINGISSFVADLAKAGVITYDVKLENYLRSLVDSPLTDGSGKVLGLAATTDSNLASTPTSTGKPTGGAKHS
jgi:hypothetical protein